MNALPSTVHRQDEVQSKIRKIRSFGRNARSVCAVLLGFGLVAVVMLVVATTFGSEPNGGSGNVYDILTSQRTPLQFKAWVLLLVGMAIGVWLAVVHQLYRLFGNLAAGAIYTSENVRRVRYIGLGLLLLPVLSMATSVTLVVVQRLIDSSVSSDLDRLLPSISQLLSSFIAAGLVLLVSWIMDVGLYEKEHADTLRSDADLVI